jgi:hypothetical protein
MTEFQRLHELSVGHYWVNDPEQLLYCCLESVEPKNSHLVEFEKPLSSSYIEAVKFLYQAVGQSNDEELKSPQGYDMAAERICGACLAYLERVMAPDEFASFKAANPTRKFKSIMHEICAMFEEEQ